MYHKIIIIYIRACNQGIARKKERTEQELCYKRVLLAQGRASLIIIYIIGAFVPMYIMTLLVLIFPQENKKNNIA